ncbi:hypothetical protein D3C73_1627740 [compost metagenome]
MSRKVIRITNELVTKKYEDDPNFLYNGAPEEYEDSADYVQINVIKAVKIA